ncbi:hypothetical protein EJ04DRAFT_568836 [Polyplosphaeria fusca]|uniref:Uncharacterized protein n=1 Tax=Polyplosphaeria fusca TaxID=682080 RepID=A0A9P4QP82_9PLEO|nr:hypothetical protein EJ04DRAFT_568836 [Polyplosphaeria fusca]
MRVGVWKLGTFYHHANVLDGCKCTFWWSADCSGNSNDVIVGPHSKHWPDEGMRCFQCVQTSQTAAIVADKTVRNTPELARTPPVGLLVCGTITNTRGISRSLQGSSQPVQVGPEPGNWQEVSVQAACVCQFWWNKNCEGGWNAWNTGPRDEK